MINLKTLVTKRHTLNARMTRLDNFLKYFKNELRVGEVRAPTQHFKPIIYKFEIIQSQVEDVDDSIHQVKD